MAILGFITLCLILGWITFAVVFTFFNPFGDSPGVKDSIGFLIIACIIGYGWYQLFLHSPFSITVK